MKIWIIGSVGSGKTTLAGKLSGQTGIPFYEVDCIVHDETDSERRKRTPQEQAGLLRDIDRQPHWILEGTYRPSCHLLFELADTILFLDPPASVRRRRILKRFCRQKLGLESCHYRSDFHMLRMMYRWTREFEAGRPAFERMLAAYPEKLITAHCEDEAASRLKERNYAGYQRL